MGKLTLQNLLNLIIVTAFCLISSPPLFGRDVNLDDIYIKKSSRYKKKLLIQKIEAYQKIDAIFVDNDVIFSQWISGDEVYFIRENSILNVNIIYKYILSSGKKIEICRLKGIITISKICSNGRFLVLKRLLQKKKIMPEGEMLILNFHSKKYKIKKSRSCFLDFSIPWEGNSVIYEGKKGFIELFFDSGIKKLILKKSKYSDITSPYNLSIAYFSPDRRSVIVMNGNGGKYNAKLLLPTESIKLKSITSSSEIFWIDNRSLVFREGFPGKFSVTIYDTKNKKMLTILKNSIDTHLSFSLHPKILSCLKEQIIFFYNTSLGLLTNTGIEGGDIYFSPSGSRFTSIFSKKLFIVNINTLLKRRIELQRVWHSILLRYRELTNRNQELVSEYSPQYVKRKVKIYENLTQQD